MIQLRATKYDPRNRDALGHYRIDEWTSISDIGKTIGGRAVTETDYLVSEDAYVDAVRELLIAANTQTLQVVDLEDRRTWSKGPGQVDNLRPVVLHAICEGMTVRGDAIDAIVRIALRELVWCRLLGSNGVYVHFGYDFYMYLGADVDDRLMSAPPAGMFYEVFESPYG